VKLEGTDVLLSVLPARSVIPLNVRTR